METPFFNPQQANGAKVADILGIDYKTEFKDEGEHADKSVGWVFAQKLSNFWKAVSGDTGVPNRRTLGK
jgi:hypothetical protein